MRIVVPVLLAMIVCLLPYSLVAQDGEIRRITQTTATSDCIGDPKTPLCAVETLLACWSRHDNGLCDAVRMGMGGFSFPKRTIEYRLTFSKVMKETDKPLSPSDHIIPIPGAFELGVERRVCAIEFETCESGAWQQGFYAVDKKDGRWWVSEASFQRLTKD